VWVRVQWDNDGNIVVVTAVDRIGCDWGWEVGWQEAGVNSLLHGQPNNTSSFLAWVGPEDHGGVIPVLGDLLGV
jgi:hypothetical protein